MATIETLGGSTIFPRLPHNALELHRLILAGFPGPSVRPLEAACGLPRDALSQLLGISVGTYKKRSRKGNRWHPWQSDRIWALAQALEMARETLGSRAKASRWLQKPHQALGGVPPWAMLQTAVGAGEVRDLLGRMQAGIHA